MTDKDKLKTVLRPAPGGLTTTATATTGVLSRTFAASFEKFILMVGQQLGAQFQLTRQGHANIISALNGLRSLQSMATCLEFGFGITHLVRDLAENEEGMMSMSLCAALAECYEVDVAAEILMEMVRPSGSVQDFLPSIKQCQSLLEACAGVLAATDFPILVEKYMQLHPTDRDFDFGVRNRFGKTKRGCSHPESLAKALLAIGQLTHKRLEAFSISGGADAGFLAAFAEWHFQLSLQIIHTATGRVLHTGEVDTPDHEGCVSGLPLEKQLTVFYEDHTSHSEDTVRVTEKVFQLEDATTLIHLENPTKPFMASVAGRVEWGTLLTQTFNYELKRLLECSQAFGSALGCLCRIARGLAFAENDINSDLRIYSIHYVVNSYGRGLVTQLLKCFPEISPVEGFIENATRLELRDAINKYDLYIAVLKSACNCLICQGSCVHILQENYCLVLLVELLVVIARVKSVTTVPPGMMPSRIGIEILYQRQDKKRINEEFAQDVVERLGPAAYALIGTATERSVTYDAMVLYGGRQTGPSFMSSNWVAAVMNGVCGLWNSLCRFGLEEIPVGLVTIVPGQIILNKQTYSRLLDTKIVSSTVEPSDLPVILQSKKISLIIKEKTDALYAHFEVLNPRRKNLKIDVQLDRLTKDWLMVTGEISCKGTGRCKKSSMVSKMKKLSRDCSTYKDSGFELSFYHQATALQAMMLLSAGYGEKFIVDSQCLDCCASGAFSYCSRYGIGYAIIIRVRGAMS